jgi:hypothetical protein
MSKGWDNIAEGMKVEIVNKDCPLKDTTVYWVATVMKLAGVLLDNSIMNHENKDSLP